MLFIADNYLGDYSLRASIIGNAGLLSDGNIKSKAIRSKKSKENQICRSGYPLNTWSRNRQSTFFFILAIVKRESAQQAFTSELKGTVNIILSLILNHYRSSYYIFSNE
jgi:hypothetical protein